MYQLNGTVHIEADDQCAACHHFSKGVACPLLEALCTGVVTLTEDIKVGNCGFYKPFKRSLQLVATPSALEPLYPETAVTTSTPTHDDHPSPPPSIRAL